MPDSFEYWLLNHAPIVKATKERFNIFQAETQKLINSNMNLASIPCGSMNDLLTLDYSNLKNMHLVGVDIDLDSINLTHNNINKDENKKYTYEVIQGDAWELEKFLDKKFDLITSNGLNIYESNETKLIELYKSFYSSLTPGGYLITSFISQSPMVNENSPWKDYNLEDLKKQKAVFGDIIKAKWQNSLSEERAVYQLETAGFKISKVIYDSQGMFPTIVAYRNV